MQTNPAARWVGFELATDGIQFYVFATGLDILDRLDGRCRRRTAADRGGAAGRRKNRGRLDFTQF